MVLMCVVIVSVVVVFTAVVVVGGMLCYARCGCVVRADLHVCVKLWLVVRVFVLWVGCALLCVLLGVLLSV